MLGARERLTDGGAGAHEVADDAEARGGDAALGEVDAEVVVAEGALGGLPDRLVEVRRDAQVAM
jgi:hypothetical protein